MSHRQTSVAYRVLVDMIAGLLVGGFLGYWLDRWLGWAPYSLVAGLVLGFAAGVNNAWRAIRVYSEDAAGGDEGNRASPEAVRRGEVGTSQMHSPMEQFEIKRLLDFHIGGSTPPSPIPRSG